MTYVNHNLISCVDCKNEHTHTHTHTHTLHKSIHNFHNVYDDKTKLIVTNINC